MISSWREGEKKVRFRGWNTKKAFKWFYFAISQIWTRDEKRERFLSAMPSLPEDLYTLPWHIIKQIIKFSLGENKANGLDDTIQHLWLESANSWWMPRQLVIYFSQRQSHKSNLRVRPWTTNSFGSIWLASKNSLAVVILAFGMISKYGRSMKDEHFDGAIKRPLRSSD